MVLDPLSAFSVACNVIQVIDFGVKVLSKAADYRKAETGVLAEQKDLRDVLQSLSNLNTDLLALLPEKTQHTVEEARLSKVNSQCLRLSKEFIEFLNCLKLKDKHAVFDSLRVSIKTFWHRDRMNAMENSLSQARDNLNVAFLVYMNSKQATQATQNEIFKNTTRVEGSILEAVTSTSDSLHDDIKSLAAQLENVRLESVQQTVAQFTASHRDLLERLSNRLDSIFALHTDFRALSDESQMATARQKILDSLHFPQIRERKDHVLKAYNKTYRWILEPETAGTQCSTNFILWLRASNSESRIYWVHGKIGAGKTTLLRFIDDNLSLYDHMSPWAEEVPLIRASFFFWNAGNKLQKSMAGLLRTLLTQLFEQSVDLIPRLVQPRKWQTARLAGNHDIGWTDSELRECLKEYVMYTARSRKIFFLVDGLDEFEGTDEAREDLIDFLVALAAYEHVKICLSSRPWNIFWDAFECCPGLKLEDLTYNDINAYVREQLYGSKRFYKLMQYDIAAAEGLVESLISKAAGVFLWVRLVVKQLLRSLHDGDGIRALRKIVEEIPADLDDYFMRLMESIEPRNRKEAAELLQLALYDEDWFISGHSNCLLDFSFIEEGKPDFALDPSYNFTLFDFTDTGAMAFRVDSTMRKVISRCMGLLECQRDTFRFFEANKFDEESNDEESDGEVSTTMDFGYQESNKINVRSDAAGLLNSSEVFNAAYLTVDFIHRSLRDFLLTPKVQMMLHKHTQGPYDARMFFRNARLVQLVALNRAEVDLSSAVGLASYILSTLTVPEYRDTTSAAAIATIVRPVIENLVRFKCTENLSGWYIACVLQSWRDENSSFLTLAIDFGLNSYVSSYLTPQSVQTKEGRPILDYVLRPRFARQLSGCVGNQLPDLALLKIILGFGADPNQRYQGISIWAHFLCFIADHFQGVIWESKHIKEAVYFEALKIMIQNGAEVLLPKTWISNESYFEAYVDYYEECFGVVQDEMVADERFRRRFPYVTPIIQGSTSNDTFYAVSDLLEGFCTRVGFSLATLKTLILHREVQSPASELSG